MEFNLDIIHVIGHQADEQLRVSDDGEVRPEDFFRSLQSCSRSPTFCQALPEFLRVRTRRQNVVG